MRTTTETPVAPLFFPLLVVSSRLLFPVLISVVWCASVYPLIARFYFRAACRNRVSKLGPRTDVESLNPPPPESCSLRAAAPARPSEPAASSRAIPTAATVVIALSDGARAFARRRVARRSRSSLRSCHAAVINYPRPNSGAEARNSFFPRPGGISL